MDGLEDLGRGVVERLVHGVGEFGVAVDSLADFLDVVYSGLAAVAFRGNSGRRAALRSLRFVSSRGYCAALVNDLHVRVVIGILAPRGNLLRYRHFVGVLCVIRRAASGILRLFRVGFIASDDVFPRRLILRNIVICLIYRGSGIFRSVGLFVRNGFLRPALFLFRTLCVHTYELVDIYVVVGAGVVLALIEFASRFVERRVVYFQRSGLLRYLSGHLCVTDRFVAARALRVPFDALVQQSEQLVRRNVFIRSRAAGTGSVIVTHCSFLSSDYFEIKTSLGIQ